MTTLPQLPPSPASTLQCGHPAEAEGFKFNGADSLSAPIFKFIAEAQEAGQLLRAERILIPHCIGITDEERAALHQAVRDRFGELNRQEAGAINPFSKGRWARNGEMNRQDAKRPRFQKDLRLLPTSGPKRAKPASITHD